MKTTGTLTNGELWGRARPMLAAKYYPKRVCDGTTAAIDYQPSPATARPMQQSQQCAHPACLAGLASGLNLAGYSVEGGRELTGVSKKVLTGRLRAADARAPSRRFWLTSRCSVGSFGSDPPPLGTRESRICRRFIISRPGANSIDA